MTVESSKHIWRFLKGILIISGPIPISYLIKDCFELKEMEIIINQSLRIFSVFLLAMYIKRVESQTVASIGLKRLKFSDIAYGFLFFLFGIVVFGISGWVANYFELNNPQSGVDQLQLYSMGTIFMIALTAALYEEVLFRGYGLLRLAKMIGNIHVASLISFLIFFTLHLNFWGLGASIQIATWSLILYGIMIWKKNLNICIVTHFLNDLFAFLIVPMVLNSN